MSSGSNPKSGDNNDNDDEKLHWESGWSCYATFVEENGHNNVDKTEKPALYQWVQEQKENYKLLVQGEPCGDLDQGKVGQLKAKGFQFEVTTMENDDDDDDNRKPAATKRQRNEQDSVPIPEIERMGSELEGEDDDDDHILHGANSTEEEDGGGGSNRKGATPKTRQRPRKARMTTHGPEPPPQPRAAAAAATTTPTAAASEESTGRYPRRHRRTISDAAAPETVDTPPARAKRIKVDTTSSSPSPSKHNYQVVKTSEKTGKKEVRTYETRSLTRLIPEEQEDQVREQCKVEFAELLKTDDPMEVDKERGVDHQTARSNVQWEEGFLDFLVFKKVYGHGIVPKVWVEKPSLGSWTVRNRRAWKNKDKKLTRCKKRRLDEAGFVWDAKKHPDFWKIQNQTSQDQQKFETKFNMLLEYKQEHGDCLVPKEYKPNMVLARWVSEMRKQKKAKTEGRMHNLSDEKEQRLVEVGFVFNSRTKELLRESVLNRFKDRWDASFEKLVAFKKKYGHCAVPRRWKVDQDLASWAMRQRSNGKKMMRGEPNYLNQERFDQLKSVDFVFYLDRHQYPMEGVNPPPRPMKTGADEDDAGATDEDGTEEAKRGSVSDVDRIKSTTANDPALEQQTNAAESSATEEAPRGRRNPRRQAQTPKDAETTKASDEKTAAKKVVTPKKGPRTLKKASAQTKQESSSPKQSTRRSIRSSSTVKTEPIKVVESRSLRKTGILQRIPSTSPITKRSTRRTRASEALEPADETIFESNSKRGNRKATEAIEPIDETTSESNSKPNNTKATETLEPVDETTSESNSKPTNESDIVEEKDEAKTKQIESEVKPSPDQNDEEDKNATKKVEKETQKGLTEEELKQHAMQELLKANKGRWVCELSGKLSYVDFLAHQAIYEGLESIAVRDDATL